MDQNNINIYLYTLKLTFFLTQSTTYIVSPTNNLYKINIHFITQP